MHVRTIVQVDGNVNVLYDYAGFGLVWSRMWEKCR